MCGRKSIVVVAIAAMSFMSGAAHAQGTPPCGVPTLAPTGQSVDARFFAYPQDIVLQRVKQAVTGVGFIVKDGNATTFDAEADERRIQAAQSKMSPKGALGYLKVALETSTEGGTQGTKVSVQFRRSKWGGVAGKGGWATPVLDETACLLESLIPQDARTAPRGLAAEPSSAQADARLPAGTSIKVRLQEALYSRELKQDSVIVFQVAEDVSVDGSVVIRRGALSTGKVTRMQGAKGYGRGADLDLVIDSVTAIDGQKVSLEEKAERAGSTKSHALATGSLAFGGLVKGTDVMIRAATEYVIQTNTDHLIKLR